MLLQNGWQVRGLLRQAAHPRWRWGAGVEPGVGDVCDLDPLRAEVADVDVVFHLVARVTDWRPRRNFKSGTVDGTRAAAEAKVGHLSCFVPAEPWQAIVP